MVQGLVPYYKKVTIQKALHLSGSQFNQRCVEQLVELDVASSPVLHGFARGQVKAPAF